jgi:hypothetical protein
MGHGRFLPHPVLCTIHNHIPTSFCSKPLQQNTVVSRSERVREHVTWNHSFSHDTLLLRLYGAETSLCIPWRYWGRGFYFATLEAGGGGEESNSIQKCQGGPLPSLPVQTNRSTSADESPRLYTLISAIDRTNENLRICLTFDGCFFDCWRPLKRLHRLHTYLTKRTVQNPFVLNFRTLTLSEDSAESNGRWTGEGRILKVVTNTDNIPTLSSKAEEIHRTLSQGCLCTARDTNRALTEYKHMALPPHPNCSLITWLRNPNSQTFTTEISDQHHTPNFLFLWTAPLNEPD